MVRFEHQAPWHFGYTPSDYYETLNKAQKQKAPQQMFSLRNIDEIFNLTLQIPPPRKLVLDEVIDAASLIHCREMLIVSHVASYCKPFGEFDIPLEFTKDIMAVGEAHGMGMSIGRSAFENCVTVAADHALLSEFKKIERTTEKLSARSSERNIVLGMLFGYPIGEVFSWTFEFNYNIRKKIYRPAGLFFASYPRGWSPSWRKEVGYRGQEHLKAVSEQYSFNGRSVPSHLL